MKLVKFLRKTYFTENLQWLFLTVADFQLATLLKKRFLQKNPIRPHPNWSEEAAGSVADDDLL